ncbi:MAG TPA: methyltransferase [Micromonosporaceae bacterium]|jgi:16S rRNA G1207 methylase RsmC
MTADHYFTAEPTGPERAREVTFMIAGHVYRLAAAGGVFSADRLDPGTAVLLRKAPLPGPRGGTYLDLGCGYGPIACVLAGTSQNATVYALDVNQRALDLVRRNADATGVADRVHAVTAGDIPPDLTFDEIWSNPPIRVGKAELHSMLETWLPRLAPDGMAWLVVAKHLGSDSLSAWMQAAGWHVERFASQKGFRILHVTRN